MIKTKLLISFEKPHPPSCFSSQKMQRCLFYHSNYKSLESSLAPLISHNQSVITSKCVQNLNTSQPLLYDHLLSHYYNSSGLHICSCFYSNPHTLIHLSYNIYHTMARVHVNRINFHLRIKYKSLISLVLGFLSNIISHYSLHSFCSICTDLLSFLKRPRMLEAFAGVSFFLCI